MMAAFAGGLVLTLYKVYLFLPQKPLADDDTTSESVELLERILVETDRNNPSLSDGELYLKMTEHPEFDAKHFWRFNENRVRHLVEHYRFKNPDFRR